MNLAQWPASVYRHYNDDGVLLYIGKTCQGGHRQCQHATGKAWWDEVALTEWEHFVTEDEALAAETAAIIDEAPLYNIADNVNRGSWHTVRPETRSGFVVPGRPCLDCGQAPQADDGTGLCVTCWLTECGESA